MFDLVGAYIEPQLYEIESQTMDGLAPCRASGWTDAAKLRGEGGKKRGPELDNIGNLLTVDDIKQKILDPKSWMAEGFEKEFEKGKMPDKYKDLMEETDVVALATWLVTFKNTSVNTPKPIKKK